MILRVNLNGQTVREEKDVTGAAAILVERLLRRTVLDVPGVKKNDETYVITVASGNGSVETVKGIVDTAVRTGIAEAKKL